MNDTVSLVDVVYILFKNRRIILTCTIVTIAVSALISLVLPKWYKARATILPPESATSQGDLAGLLMFAGYQPALIPSLTSPTDIYAAILESRKVTDAVIDSLNLVDEFGLRSRVKTIARLEKYTDISVTNEGLVEILYEDRDRERSAAVANALVDELDRFNRESRVTSAKRVRQFIEHRIEQVTRELETAETGLQKFKEKTGAIAISEQTRASIETAAEIYGRIAELEVGIERLRQFATDRSPEIVDLRSQIRALERKLGEMGFMERDANTESGSTLFPSFENAPEFEKRLAELMRDVEIKRSVFTVLSGQYEEARIQEMRDTPTLQVLDRASAPLSRSRPRRKAIVLVSTAFAFLLSSFVVFSRTRLHQPDGPRPESAVAGISEMVRSDFRSLRQLFRFDRRGGES
jgi:tyrosine-protein kinase Etk/Wzc